MSQKLLGLKVSDNHRYIIKEDDEDFFWLGDTAWELFHRLTLEEAKLYFKVRAEQGFTVIQAVALAEYGGITTGNAYGRKPFLQNTSGQYDPSLPDTSNENGPSYWDYVDKMITLAENYGLYIAFLPTWGDKYHRAWGEGPEIFDGSNAYGYGKWLGKRYRYQKNLIWVVGGDRMLTTKMHFDVVEGMAKGLQEGDQASHLMTFHPQGGFSSSFHVHDAEWLDFNMIQSGHAPTERDNFRHVMKDYDKRPVKPTLDAEPCYEDHPRGQTENGYFDDVEVRKAAYYALFAGAFGHTYGHHCVWPMYSGNIDSSYGEPSWLDLANNGEYFLTPWQEALQRPGALQMKHVKDLLEARPMRERVPDQSLLINNRTGSNFMTACRGKSYAMIYTPNGLEVEVKLGILPGSKVNASWFDPRTGHWDRNGSYKNTGTHMFDPPTKGRGSDWVLVIDQI